MPGGLIRCLKSRSSLVQRRLQSSAILKGDQLGPVHEEEHQTFRVRKDGTPLPLPPLLDPVVIAERGRWQQPKAKPNVEKFTPFQQKLWQNPFAHALASPIRQCRPTGILLPSALLVSLHARPHPETSDPWLLPVSLTTSDKHLGFPYRFLGRKLVVEALGTNKQWSKVIDRRFETKLGRAKLSKLVWREDMPDLILSLLRKRTLDKLRWHFKHSGQLVPCDSPRPEDIADIEDVSCVLYFGSLKTRADEMQAQAEEIMHIVEHYSSVVSSTVKDHLDPHEAKHVTHRAPAWYRDSPLIAPRLQPRAIFPPLEFPTTEWKGSRVALYSLYDLLGEEKQKELVQDSRFQTERCLVIKRGRHNVPIELLLMQLQLFLALPAP